MMVVDTNYRNQKYHQIRSEKIEFEIVSNLKNSNMKKYAKALEYV